MEGNDQMKKLCLKFATIMMCFSTVLLVSSPVWAAKKKVIKVKKSKRVSQDGGADSTEGWIIKHTDQGIIKIPRKQTFKFSGSEVGGQAQSPSQSVMGKRPQARPATLIPERRSFRNEYFESAGIQDR